MKDIIFKSYGRNGIIELYANRIVIKRRGGVQHSIAPFENKVIYLDDLRNVNFSKATDMLIGYIQFETYYNSDQLSNGLFMTAPIDNFSVSFSKNQQLEFELLQSEICHLRNRVIRSNIKVDSTGLC